jgi:hypothetical protein
MEGSARGAPFCKKILCICRVSSERIGRREEAVTLLQSALEHIVKRHFILIQTEQFFLHVVVHMFMSS